MGDLVTVNGYVAVAILLPTPLLLLYYKYGTRTTGCAASEGWTQCGLESCPPGEGTEGILLP